MKNETPVLFIMYACFIYFAWDISTGGYTVAEVLSAVLILTLLVAVTVKANRVYS